jgi:hypothetical protein
VIPAPGDAGKPRHRGGRNGDGPREAAGWLTLIEALDRAVASMVARIEHQLTAADAARAARLRRQLTGARRLEAATAAARQTALRSSGSAPPPEPRCPRH